MRTVEVKLFGAFRKHFPEGKISIELSDEVSVASVKELIHEKLNQNSASFAGSNLVFDSALATEEEILHEDSLIRQVACLALLPPVCGG